MNRRRWACTCGFCTNQLWWLLPANPGLPKTSRYRLDSSSCPVWFAIFLGEILRHTLSQHSCLSFSVCDMQTRFVGLTRILVLSVFGSYNNSFLINVQHLPIRKIKISLFQFSVCKKTIFNIFLVALLFRPITVCNVINFIIRRCCSIDKNFLEIVK